MSTSGGHTCPQEEDTRVHPCRTRTQLENSYLVPHNSMSHLVTVTVTPPPRVSSSGGHSPRVPRTHHHRATQG